MVAADGINEDIDGVKIRSISTSYKSRLWRMTRVARNVYKKALAIDANIYHLHDPELLPYGIKLKGKGKKVMYDSHEDYPLNCKTKQWLPTFAEPLISFIFTKYEEKAVKSFDAVISVTPQIVKRFMVSNKNAAMITNFPISSNRYANDGLRQNNICFAGSDIITENASQHY